MMVSLIFLSQCTASSVSVNFTTYGPNWDINQDGNIDVFDVSLLVTNYALNGPPGWIPEDIVHDGHIDIFDVSALVTHYGERWTT